MAKTFEFDEKLPSLPLPTLKETLERYEDSLKPFDSGFLEIRNFKNSMHFLALELERSDFSFWPRAALKGPESSFVFVLVVGVELNFKNEPSQTKNVPGNNEFVFLANFGIELSCLPCMILCGLLWSCMA